jgi:succinate dehydrogenase/fumarate reductase flavoprotein subunit
LKGGENMATKIMECDLVVLGGGGAGLVAAVKANEDSGKKVIVLEKAKNPGGSSWFAGGPGVGSQGGGGAQGGPGGMAGAAAGMTAAAGGQGGQSASVGGQGSPGGQGGAPPGMGGGMGGMGGFSTWYASKVGTENYVKTARMDKFKELPDPSIGPGRGGTFLIEKMLDFCQKQGIQVLTETPAKKFVTDSNGRITGVLADSRDGELLVKCRACIIASGGFGSNYEKLKRYWPEQYNNKEIFFLCPPGMMGDGIDMAEAIGAYIDQTKWNQDVAGGFMLNYPIHHPYSWALMQMMADGKVVSVNLDGKRWMNEGGAKVSVADQPGAVAYAVVDDEIAEAIGSDLAAGNAGDGMIKMMAKDPASNEAKALKRWREDLEYEAALDEGHVTHGNHAKKANSLVELALKMQTDPRVFVETIERYNKFCETGKDLEFNKDAKYLKPIRKPPFYGIYGHRFSQCTKGLNGIAVNPNYEVLNPKGETISGLYAAGDTCTIYGRSGTAAAGGSILSTTPTPNQGAMMAFSSGYTAGVNAAEYFKKI